MKQLSEHGFSKVLFVTKLKVQRLASCSTLIFCFFEYLRFVFLNVLDQCTEPFMRLTSSLWGVLLCNAQLSSIKNRLIDVVFQIFNAQVFYYLYHMIRWLYFTVQAKLRLICKRVSVRCVWNNLVLLLHI